MQEHVLAEAQYLSECCCCLVQAVTRNKTVLIQAAAMSLGIAGRKFASAGEVSSKCDSAEAKPEWMSAAF